MTNQEHTILTELLRQSHENAKTIAWIKGTLQEVHTRTAEIPVIVEDQVSMRTKIQTMRLAIVAGILLTAKSVWDSFSHLFK